MQFSFTQFSGLNPARKGEETQCCAPQLPGGTVNKETGSRRPESESSQSMKVKLIADDKPKEGMGRD